jgi:hypothetical protein
MISAACRAEEEVGLDELERYADLVARYKRDLYKDIAAMWSNYDIADGWNLLPGERLDAARDALRFVISELEARSRK